MFFSIINILLLFSSMVYSASLNSDPVELEIKTDSSKKRIEGSFKLTNSSEKEVKVVSVKASCGCVLVNKLQKILPGQSATVSFEGPVPRAGGQYEKFIYLDTDEKEGIDYKLKFRVINTDKSKRKIQVIKAPGVKNNHASYGYQRPKTMSERDLLMEKLLALKALQKKDRLSVQDECPFLPLGILPKLYYDFDGMRIFTCCEQCLVKVKESPHHAIIKLAEKGQKPVMLD